MSLVDVEIVRLRPDAVVVECTGEHDLATNPELGTLLIRLVEKNDVVIVDVSNAEYIDSSFINQLLVANELSRSQGKRLVFQLGGKRIVGLAVERSGVLQVLEHASTREEALEPARG